MFEYPPAQRCIQIDHFPESDKYAPHENGTFRQRYFFDATYYKPGGPVFLYVGGETSGPSRFVSLLSPYNTLHSIWDMLTSISIELVQFRDWKWVLYFHFTETLQTH